MMANDDRLNFKIQNVHKIISFKKMPAYLTLMTPKTSEVM